MPTVVKHFLPSVLVSVAALIALFFYGGLAAFLTAVLLTILEVTLSFDNAVVNAKVLERMDAKWRRRFLTWGILVAVFGTRLVLPILIVSLVAWANPVYIAQLVFLDPHRYGELLEEAGYAVHAFGAAFLLMVSLKYFLDANKKVHWIHALEQHLTKWGRIEAIEIILALSAIIGMSFLVPHEAQGTVVTSGVIGVILFVMMQAIMSAFSLESKEVAASGAALFVYLEVLDAAFSLDGVIGAFALTSAIPIIAVGLGIGAYFVRSLTIFMVKHKTLATLRYLEHGAHWAIFGLSGSMFANLVLHVPEIVTGTIGLVFVVAAYYSSLTIQKKRT
jgi:uncharacterized protein